MSKDCQWVESRLMDFLSDSADLDVRTRIDSHLETCHTCRNEVEGYGEIDKRVRAYFDHQLALAEGGGRLSFRPMRLAGAFAGVGVVAIALWMGMGTSELELPPALEEATLAATAVDDSVLKALEETDVLRAKPEESTAIPDQDLRTAEPNAVAAPSPDVTGDLYVTDAVGYSQTLADYSGSILVLGVFDETGHFAFEEAHAAYGTDARFSFVGVSLNPNTLPETITFPLMSNRGSSLLGTPAGAFTIVGPDGAIHRRGLFEVDSLVDVLGSSLEELGVR